MLAGKGRSFFQMSSDYFDQKTDEHNLKCVCMISLAVSLSLSVSSRKPEESKESDTEVKHSDVEFENHHLLAE
jgi:hypothetical protein